MSFLPSKISSLLHSESVLLCSILRMNIFNHVPSITLSLLHGCSQIRMSPALPDVCAIRAELRVGLDPRAQSSVMFCIGAGYPSDRQTHEATHVDGVAQMPCTPSLVDTNVLLAPCGRCSPATPPVEVPGSLALRLLWHDRLWNQLERVVAALVRRPPATSSDTTATAVAVADEQLVLAKTPPSGMPLDSSRNRLALAGHCPWSHDARYHREQQAPPRDEAGLDQKKRACRSVAQSGTARRQRTTCPARPRKAPGQAVPSPCCNVSTMAGLHASSPTAKMYVI